MTNYVGLLFFRASFKSPEKCTMLYSGLHNIFRAIAKQQEKSGPSFSWRRHAVESVDKWSKKLVRLLNPRKNKKLQIAINRKTNEIMEGLLLRTRKPNTYPKTMVLKNCPLKMREGKLWEWFKKLTEKHQILCNKKFFPAAINGRYKNYEEHQGQL